MNYCEVLVLIEGTPKGGDQRKNGAANGARTHDLVLGKDAL